MEKKISSQKPILNLQEGPEMLKDFTRESQRHLISARNALLVLDNFSTDKEAIEILFKTFRTINGFADFLELHDISNLSAAVNHLMERVQSEKKSFDSGARRVIRKSTERLQQLLEMLDEQIDNGGAVPDAYPNIEDDLRLLNGPLSEICEQSSEMSSGILSDTSKDQDVDLAVIENLKTIINNNQSLISVERDILKTIYEQFENVWSRLCDARKEIESRRFELINERELAIRLTDKAQAEARAKSDHLAHISHEIRTLINAILGFADVVRSRLPADSPEQAHIQTILLSGKMLLEIVNTVLDYAKVEAGRLTLESVEFSLLDVIEEVFQIIRTRIDRKPVNLYTNIFPEASQYLMVGDPTRLKQVLLNLVDNAIKFTDKGEVGLTVCLEDDHCAQGSCRISFEVSDTGVGIPEEKAQDVFESYTQAETSTARRYGGTGLGLSLCRLFIDAMKGTISLDSELGSGTVFHFSIPFNVVRRPESTADLKTDRIFGLVSDFESTAQGFKNVCRVIGAGEPYIFQNVKQAVEFFEREKRHPDVILVDLLLGKEAQTFIRRLREQEAFAAVKVIALTNDVHATDEKSVWQENADAVMYSPILSGELKTCLDKIFHINALGQENHGCLGSASAGKHIHVLVVEDSVPNQELLKLYFHDLQCSCRIAGNGKEALEILSEETFDLCFMDLQMPLMDGMEVTRRIRKDLQLDLPIVALTAAQADEERESCLANGMTDYLAKPFTIEQLKDMVCKYITTENNNE